MRIRFDGGMRIEEAGALPRHGPLRYWLLKNLVVVPLLHLVFRIEVHGRENIPRAGAALIASNHVSAIDSLFVPLVIPRHVTFLAKAQFFEGKGFGGWFRRGFMSAMGQLPIDRGGGAESVAALHKGVQVLRAGRLLGIYPEGTRSDDGRLHRGRTGIARTVLAAGLSAPVVPVAVEGTDHVLPIGRVFPRLGTRIVITFGEPLDFSRYAGMLEDRVVLRSITDEIVGAIAAMSTREYVDVYASAARRPAAAARRAAPAPRAPSAPQTASSSTAEP